MDNVGEDSEQNKGKGEEFTLDEIEALLGIGNESQSTVEADSKVEKPSLSTMAAIEKSFRELEELNEGLAEVTHEDLTVLSSVKERNSQFTRSVHL